jgi:integrase
MRQRKKGRVLGPYPNRDGWRIVVVTRDGARHSSVHPSEEAAADVAAELRAQLALEEVTVSQAIGQYAEHLRVTRERRAVSVTRTMFHLHSMMPDGETVLADIGPRQAAALYAAMCGRVSDRTGKVPAVDSQRNALNECGTFARWAVRNRYLQADPFKDVEAKGRRKRGKPQLRVDEARVFYAVTLSGAKAGDRGAMVSLLILLTGFRATESAQLEGRDVDDDGHLLWIDDSKTEAGKRRMTTPPELVEPLKAVAREGGSLWPKTDRHWVHRQVVKWCKLAGVSRVTPHGLRGTHASLAQENGATSLVVAAALGHTSHVVTERHYTALGVTEQAQARRAQRLLTGKG